MIKGYDIGEEREYRDLMRGPKRESGDRVRLTSEGVSSFEFRVSAKPVTEVGGIAKAGRNGLCRNPKLET